MPSRHSSGDISCLSLCLYGLLTYYRDHPHEDVGVEADPDDGEDEGEKEVAAVLLRPAVRDGGDSEEPQSRVDAFVCLDLCLHGKSELV